VRGEGRRVSAVAWRRVVGGGGLHFRVHRLLRRLSLVVVGLDDEDISIW
jgi:hypothetical protein